MTISFPLTVKRSELNRLVQAKSIYVPASIRVSPRLSLEWTGKGWTRQGNAEPAEVSLIEG